MRGARPPGLAWALWLCCSAACRPTPEGAARDTAGRYLRALTRPANRQGRDGAEAAYALLSAEFRATCDLACFRARGSGDREAARDALQRLPGAEVELFALWSPAPPSEPQKPPQAGAPAAPPLLSELALPMLQHDGTGWRFTSNPLDFYPQDTPERCLRSFLRALAGQRTRVLLRFLPQALREKTSAEQMSAYLASSAGEALRAQAALVQQHLGEPFVLGGRGGGTSPTSDAEATLPLGERRSARLTQERDGEGARWVISALQ